jgi:general secretion pathway protein L
MDLLRNFLSWWMRQLVAMLPNRLVQMGFIAGHAAILDVGGREAVLCIRQGSELQSVARSAAEPAAIEDMVRRASAESSLPPVVLRLGAAAILRKRLSLPAGVRWHIEKVLGFALDRESPFARDEVYWAYAVRRHDSAQGTVEVDLIIVPRVAVDPTVAAIRGVGVEVAGLEVVSDDGKPLFVPLHENKRHHRLLAYRSLMGSAAAAVVIAMIAIVVPFIRVHLAIGAANREIASLTVSAEEAASLRKSVDRFGDVAAFLDKERKANGPPLAVLADITRLLPDDTHLTALSLHAGQLTINGLAPSAAKVVALISQDPMFTEPVFGAPVVQDGDSGLESFTLSLALKSGDRS